MSTSTPWGVAHTVTKIANGIRSVTASSHGGVLVSPTKNALIPDYMRDADGEYEEDCKWAIPAVVFEQEWRAWADATNWTSGEEQMKSAWQTLKNHEPDAYTKFTGHAIQIGESIVFDERILKQQTQDAFVVIAALGDWKEEVPKGMVGVLAIRKSDKEQIFCLVPKEEYKSRINTIVGKAAVFVVDPSRHQTIPIPQFA